MQAWPARHNQKIELLHLPSLGRELNPDAMLNNDMEGHALDRRRPTDEYERVADLRACLRTTQRRPDEGRKNAGFSGEALSVLSPFFPGLLGV